MRLFINATASFNAVGWVMPIDIEQLVNNGDRRRPYRWPRPIRIAFPTVLHYHQIQPNLSLNLDFENNNNRHNDSVVIQ